MAVERPGPQPSIEGLIQQRRDLNLQAARRERRAGYLVGIVAPRISADLAVAYSPQTAIALGDTLEKAETLRGEATPLREEVARVDEQIGQQPDAYLSLVGQRAAELGRLREHVGRGRLERHQARLREREVDYHVLMDLSQQIPGLPEVPAELREVDVYTGSNAAAAAANVTLPGRAEPEQDERISAETSATPIRDRLDILLAEAEGPFTQLEGGVLGILLERMDVAEDRNRIVGPKIAGKLNEAGVRFRDRKVNEHDVSAAVGTLTGKIDAMGIIGVTIDNNRIGGRHGNRGYAIHIEEPQPSSQPAEADVSRVAGDVSADLSRAEAEGAGEQEYAITVGDKTVVINDTGVMGFAQQLGSTLSGGWVGGTVIRDKTGIPQGSMGYIRGRLAGIVERLGLGVRSSSSGYGWDTTNLPDGADVTMEIRTRSDVASVEPSAAAAVAGAEPAATGVRKEAFDLKEPVGDNYIAALRLVIDPTATRNEIIEALGEREPDVPFTYEQADEALRDAIGRIRLRRYHGARAVSSTVTADEMDLETAVHDYSQGLIGPSEQWGPVIDDLIEARLGTWQIRRGEASSEAANAINIDSLDAIRLALRDGITGEQVLQTMNLHRDEPLTMQDAFSELIITRQRLEEKNTADTLNFGERQVLRLLDTYTQSHVGDRNEVLNAMLGEAFGITVQNIKAEAAETPEMPYPQSVADLLARDDVDLTDEARQIILQLIARRQLGNITTSQLAKAAEIANDRRIPGLIREANDVLGQVDAEIVTEHGRYGGHTLRYSELNAGESPAEAQQVTIVDEGRRVQGGAPSDTVLTTTADVFLGDTEAAAEGEVLPVHFDHLMAINLIADQDAEATGDNLIGLLLPSDRRHRNPGFRAYQIVTRDMGVLRRRVAAGLATVQETDTLSLLDTSIAIHGGSANFDAAVRGIFGVPLERVDVPQDAAGGPVTDTDRKGVSEERQAGHREGAEPRRARIEAEMRTALRDLLEVYVLPLFTDGLDDALYTRAQIIDTFGALRRFPWNDNKRFVVSDKERFASGGIALYPADVVAVALLLNGRKGQTYTSNLKKNLPGLAREELDRLRAKRDEANTANRK